MTTNVKDTIITACFFICLAVIFNGFSGCEAREKEAYYKYLIETHNANSHSAGKT